jgi:hypothetical protein
MSWSVGSALLLQPGNARCGHCSVNPWNAVIAGEGLPSLPDQLFLHPLATLPFLLHRTIDTDIAGFLRLFTVAQAHCHPGLFRLDLKAGFFFDGFGGLVVSIAAGFGS